MALSKKQREELSQNKYVEKVTEKQVHYTYEFKLFALRRLSQGYTPDEILEKANIPATWFRNNYAKNMLKRWRKKVRENGIHSLKTKVGRIPKLKPPFEIDYDNLEQYGNYELLQIIEYKERLEELKKKFEIPYTNEEIFLETNITNYKIVEIDD